jgi:hypothetical protein
MDSRPPSGTADHCRAADRETRSGNHSSGVEPPKRERPLIAIVGINDATETMSSSRP